MNKILAVSALACASALSLNSNAASIFFVFGTGNAVVGIRADILDPDPARTLNVYKIDGIEIGRQEGDGLNDLFRYAGYMPDMGPQFQPGMHTFTGESWIGDDMYFTKTFEFFNHGWDLSQPSGIPDGGATAIMFAAGIGCVAFARKRLVS